MEVKYVLAVALVASSGLLASCGAPGYCKQGSFPAFVEDEWRAYCVTYDEHVERPGSFELEALTSFLAEHPRRAAELRASLQTWDEPAACFQAPREKLEYRGLNSCIQHDDRQRHEMINAWEARAEAWIGEHEAQVQFIGPKLGDLAREGARLLRETNEAFEFQAQMDPADYLEWNVELRTQAEAASELSDVRDEWRDVLQRAEGVEFLREAMLADFGPRVAMLSEELISLQDRLRDLQEIRGYLELAIPAAGKPCKDGVRARKESRIAKSALQTQVKKIKGNTPRVSTRITPDERAKVEYEFFSGFVCGERNQDKQLEEQRTLCARYEYVLERKKPEGEKKWGDWYVKKISEGGVDEGVDCTLIER